MSGWVDRRAVDANQAPRRFVGVAVWVVVLTLVGVAIGISIPNSLLLAGAAVVLYGLRHLPFAASPHWPERTAATDAGARREVARLSWALAGSEHRVDRLAVRRLRMIAERRLAEDGLSLADERSRQRLGESAYTLLTGPESQRPLLNAFVPAVRAVEALLLAPSSSSGKVAT